MGPASRTGSATDVGEAKGADNNSELDGGVGGGVDGGAGNLSNLSRWSTFLTNFFIGHGRVYHVDETFSLFQFWSSVFYVPQVKLSTKTRWQYAHLTE
jgi:hypothetical protein